MTVIGEHRKTSTRKMLMIVLVSFLGVLLVCGVLMLVLGGGGGSGPGYVDITQDGEVGSSPSGSGSVAVVGGKAGDVKMKCNAADKADPVLPTVKVELEITNGGDGPRTYFISVSVVDGKGVRLANTMAVVSDVRPGEVAQQSEPLLLVQPVTGPVKCRVDKVE